MEQDFTASGGSGGAPGWMFIFADVLALLLTFFVLLFSMSTLQADGWQAVVSTFTARLNPSRPHSVRDPEADAKAAQINQPAALDLNYLASLIEIKIMDNPLLADAEVQRLGDRLVVSVPSDRLFEPGAARLGPTGATAAAGLSELFASVTNRIVVAGQAEWRPDGAAGSRAFANRWELSLARAVIIARAIRAGGYQRFIPAYGRGGAEVVATAAPGPNTGPIPGSDRALARRIDIMVMRARAQGEGG